MFRNYEIKWAAEIGWGALVAALVFLASAVNGAEVPTSSEAVLSVVAGAGRVALAYVVTKLAARFGG